MRTIEDRRREEQKLLDNIKARLQELEDLQRRTDRIWQDRFYRYHYQSYKIYGLQDLTAEYVQIFKSLSPDGKELSPRFMELVENGTGREFKLEYNMRWVEETAPIVEAFFHCREFLDLMIRCGRDFKEIPKATLPTTWGALLCLYELR